MTAARASRPVVTLAIVALALSAAAPLVLALAQSDTDGSARQVRVAGLAEVFTPGWALQDRNGDTQADFIAARIVVPETPSPEELAAATALAARLGLETSGLTLPLVFRPSDAEPSDGPRIVVGTGNTELDPAMATRARSLAAGQGLVAMTGNAVVVAGGDDVGTQAAAEAFAARSPYLWAVIGRQNGDTFDRIARDIAGLLTDARVPVSGVTFDELVYETGRREALSARVTVDIDSTLLTRARVVLDELVGRHRRGVDTDRLSYASVASLELALGRDDPAPTVVPRVGLPLTLLNPPRPPATRFQTVYGPPAPT